MRFDQKGTTVFLVVQGCWGQWDVLAEGFEKRLAAFDNCDDAIEFAQDVADTNEGSSVRIYAEDGTKSIEYRVAGGGNQAI